MEHDASCEKDKVLERVRQKLNANVIEMFVVKDMDDLCFCAERKVFGSEWILSPAGLVDRLTHAVEKILDMRTKASRAVLDIPFAPVEFRMLKYLHGGEEIDEGKVVRVDFRNKRRLLD